MTFVPPALKNVLPPGTIVKVSSTLDSSSGKKNLLDGSNETCWSSVPGLPQSIHLILPTLTPMTHFSITFQGGFAGTTMNVYLATGAVDKEVEGVEALGLVFAGKVYGKDGNGRQVFELPFPDAITSPTSPIRKHNRLLSNSTNHSSIYSASSLGPQSDASSVSQTTNQDLVKEIKIEFEKSSDPWGRITVYEVELLG